MDTDKHGFFTRINANLRKEYLRRNGTDLFRTGHSKPPEELWAIGEEHVAEGRTIYGVAFIQAKKIRERELDVFADEPPPRHAAIRNWPWTEPDPELLKAKHKELAMLLAANSAFLKK